MSREEIENTEGLLRYDLARYYAWRCHHDADFKELFNQKWQTERLKKSPDERGKSVF